MDVVRAMEKGSRGGNSMIIKEVTSLSAELGDFKFFFLEYDFKFEFERREDNVDAHNIAKNSLHLAPGRHVWLLEPPGYVKLSI